MAGEFSKTVGKSNRINVAMNSLVNFINHISSLPSDAAEFVVGLKQHHALHSLARSARLRLQQEEVARQLIRIAEDAYAFRRTPLLAPISRLLLHPELPAAFRDAGSYYDVLSQITAAEQDDERSAATLERLASGPASIYQGKAMLSLAALHFYRGDFQTALSYYKEIGREGSACGMRTATQALKMSAAILSIEGDHNGSLAMLERIEPLVRHVARAYPIIRFDHYNTYALALDGAGRAREAAAVIRLAAESPYANVYTEWRESREEIEAKCIRPNRSMVAFRQKLITPRPANQIQKGDITGAVVTPVVRHIDRHPAGRSAMQRQASAHCRGAAAPLIDFPPADGLLRVEPGPAPAHRQLENLTIAELRTRLGQTLFKRLMSKEKLRRMLQAVEAIAAE